MKSSLFGNSRAAMSGWGPAPTKSPSPGGPEEGQKTGLKPCHYEAR
jgi:hypothetical protein